MIRLRQSAGLANRLRTLAAFLYVARRKKESVYSYWPVDDETNGHFLDLFEPLPDLQFCCKLKQLGKYDFWGQLTVNSYSDKHHFNSCEAVQQFYHSLILRPQLAKVVDTFVRKHSIKKAIALHVRRTDHVELATDVGRFTGYEEFFQFVDSYPVKTTVYLATDNAETQKVFRKKYGSRVIWYKTIKPNSNLRQTTLQEAVVDVFIASYAKAFKGSGYSSFSEFIQRMQGVRSNTLSQDRNIC